MTQWIDRRRASQLIAFDELQYGSITPTDIDGIIEYKNKFYAIFEVKYCDKEVPFGQRLCIQRMVDDFNKAGKKAIGFVCEHYVHDPMEDVKLAECTIREVYYNGKWVDKCKGKIMKQALDEIVERWK